VEVRIQFKDVTQGIFHEVPRNELVLRIQPSEAVYLKMNAKEPGLQTKTVPIEMDLTYKRRFSEVKIPEAYEALILDALKGDHSNFVRQDELDVAWKVRSSPEINMYMTTHHVLFIDFHTHFTLDRRKRWLRSQAPVISLWFTRS
jgi:glucose-6-phosphate 1-dehydrogenase